MNSTLGRDAVKCTKCDVIGLVETHLRNDETIELHNYTWFGNNRKVVSKKAKKGFRGVCFLVSDELFYNFNICALNDKADDNLVAFFDPFPK